MFRLLLSHLQIIRLFMEDISIVYVREGRMKRRKSHEGLTGKNWESLCRHIYSSAPGSAGNMLQEIPKATYNVEGTRWRSG
jgi:hypothetical protein